MEGWFSTSPGTVDPGALDQAWSGISTNVWLVLAAVALAVAAVRAGARLLKDSGHEPSPRAYRHLGTGLMVFGTVLALSPAFLVQPLGGSAGMELPGLGPA